MSFFTWKDQFSVHVQEMDAQHREYFEFLNEMHDAVMRVDKKEVLERMFYNLRKYAEQHFVDEESLMRKVNYPDLALQQQQHALFITHLRELQDSYKEQQIAIPESTLAFMKDWLLEHILQQDKKYGEYLLNKGAQEIG
ncbi:MAG: bacteriohemerythrin [Geobacteraceae bacterium]